MSEISSPYNSQPQHHFPPPFLTPVGPSTTQRTHNYLLTIFPIILSFLLLWNCHGRSSALPLDPSSSHLFFFLSPLKDPRLDLSRKLSNTVSAPLTSAGPAQSTKQNSKIFIKEPIPPSRISMLHFRSQDKEATFNSQEPYVPTIKPANVFSQSTQRKSFSKNSDLHVLHLYKKVPNQRQKNTQSDSGLLYQLLLNPTNQYLSFRPTPSSRRTPHTIKTLSSLFLQPYFINWFKGLKSQRNPKKINLQSFSQRCRFGSRLFTLKPLGPTLLAIFYFMASWTSDLQLTLSKEINKFLSNSDHFSDPEPTHPLNSLAFRQNRAKINFLPFASFQQPKLSQKDPIIQSTIHLQDFLNSLPTSSSTWPSKIFYVSDKLASGRRTTSRVLEVQGPGFPKPTHNGRFPCRASQPPCVGLTETALIGSNPLFLLLPSNAIMAPPLPFCECYNRVHVPAPRPNGGPT